MGPSLDPSPESPPRFSRRRVVQLYAIGTAAVGAGALGIEAFGTSGPDRILPTASEIADTEARRATSGRVRSYELVAAASTVDLGGKLARTWAFNNQLPASEIRVSAGDQLKVRVTNQLPSATTVHWHGLALRNDMDGVPGLTRPAIKARNEFTYQFICPDPGTYWFHPHVGVQLDTGLMGALIVEDPAEPLTYDHDVVLVLDDWTDGIGTSPARNLAELATNGMQGMRGMSGMGMGMSPDSEGMGITKAKPLGDDPGDVSYPLNLINGRPPTDPFVVRAKPGARLRLRLINAGSDTAYRVEVGGHRMTAVHSDGYPILPRTVDSIIIGMGERYDVIVDAADGAFPIIARPVGKHSPPALAVLRTSARAQTPKTVSNFQGRTLGYQDLRPAPSVALSRKTPDRTVQVQLDMKGGGRRWLINGKAYPDHQPLGIKSGERVRIELVNRTMMFHPMHLHGHTFAMVQSGTPGTRKDTVNVLPMQRLAVDVQADNPGQWLLHCHNVYHGELGMMTVLSYVR